MRHQTTLRFVDAIAQTGSIRRAAEKMAITPSALNRRLLAVEGEMGVALFERMATGVRLSAAGELFVAHARRQMADMERIQSQIEDMKGARRGKVSFGFDDSLVMESFAEAVGKYGAAYPDVTFHIERISRDHALKALTTYSVDLVGVVQPEAHPNITTLATAPLNTVAVMRPSHPLAAGKSVSFNDLLSYPLILPPEGSLRDILEVAARRQDYQLRPVLECELQFAHHTLVHSDAVGFATNTATRSDVGIEGVLAVPLNRRDLPVPNLHLAQLKGRALSVPASKFADMLTQRFAEYSGEL